MTYPCTKCRGNKLVAIYPSTAADPLGQLRCLDCGQTQWVGKSTHTYRSAYNAAKADFQARTYGMGRVHRQLLAQERAQFARAFKLREMLYCPTCEMMKHWTLTGVYGFPLCKTCETQMEVKMAVPHDDVDRSDLIDPNGKYAIVRPDSQSGHSPSTRYKTKKNAEIAATRLLENMTHPGTFEVVRIVSRVTTQNVVRVINVK